MLGRTLSTRPCGGPQVGEAIFHTEEVNVQSRGRKTLPSLTRGQGAEQPAGQEEGTLAGNPVHG